MSESSNVIKYYNRSKSLIETEKVYGDKAIQFLYCSPLGQAIEKLISHKPFSKVYGYLQDSYTSKKKVPPFIDSFSIKIDEYEKGSYKNEPIEYSYKNFNEFFIRKFKKGARPFIAEPSVMPACSEARYFGYDALKNSIAYPVKGMYLTAYKLIANEKWYNVFKGGPMYIARLCPVDYHRYHYVDDGHTLDSYQVAGPLHSVNPLALKFKQEIFAENERRVSIVETKNFGKLAYIEVGATCVGKIIQSADESVPHKRGEEKGYFLFGGSTVIVIGEAGKWKPSADILENTAKGLETYLHLGDEVGSIK